MREEKVNNRLQEDFPVMWMASLHHRTHRNKPLTFKDKPYLMQLYLEKECPYIVVKKSTQCGVSEWLTVCAFVKSMNGRSIFYVLPTYGLAGRFVRNRIDRTLLYTKIYQAIIRQRTQRNQSESLFLKHIGPGSVAFVGSNTPNVFTEYPADDLIIDELDYCHQGNIEMGWERLSASEDKRQIRISNPTVEGFGIDEEYESTSCFEWHIKHDCGTWVKPDFFQHIVRKVDENKYLLRDEEFKWEDRRDIHIICPTCGKPVNKKGRGEWVPVYPGRAKHGYHISKLFSTNVTTKEIVDRFNKGLVNDTAMQRFYNADLGVAFTASGAKISDAMLDDCREDYVMRPPKGKAVCIMGIDVGKVLHVRISELNRDGRMKALYIGRADNYEDIEYLYNTFQVRVGVIDAMPETRLAKRTVASLKGMFMCYYGNVKKDSVDIQNKIVTVERTQALDNVKEAVLLKNIVLPSNARSIPEYYDHMTASTRAYDEAKQAYYWTEGAKDDHLFHAEAYGIIARKLIVMLQNR